VDPTGQLGGGGVSGPMDPPASYATVHGAGRLRVQQKVAKWLVVRQWQCVRQVSDFFVAELSVTCRRQVGGLLKIFEEV